MFAKILKMDKNRSDRKIIFWEATEYEKKWDLILQKIYLAKMQIARNF